MSRCDSVLEQVERIVSSRHFLHSGRMQRFLRFTVDQALQGEADRIKECVVGMQVFDRPADYNPRLDPIVRVEARRLRIKLERYYSSEGLFDPVRIEYPKGGYAPVFRELTAPRPVPSR